MTSSKLKITKQIKKTKLMKKILIFALLIINSFASHSQNYEKFESNNKVGFKNKDGKIMIPATFHAAWNKFSDGLVGVHNGKKWGYIDSTGKLIIPYKYDEVSEFCGGVALVYVLDRKNYDNDRMGCVDKTGKEIIPTIYYRLVYTCGTGDSYSPIGTFLAKSKTGEGVLSHFGNIRIPLIYNIKEYIHHGISSFFIVQKDGKFGTIDDMGKMIIPFKYDKIEDYGSRGFLIVKLKEKEGHVDYSGNEL